jgi:cell division GTPase FtsZ
MAAESAIASPLLETSINGAKGVLINIAASTDVSLDDVDIASAMIQRRPSRRTFDLGRRLQRRFER